MYLLGHLGSALGLHFIFEKIKGERNPERMVFVAIGSMLPDIIDKPIGAFIFSKGRWFGHSLVGLTSLLLLAILVTHVLKERNVPYDKFGYYLYIGSLIHLLGDQPYLNLQVVFWPILGQFPTTGTGTFLLGFNSLYIKITEGIGLAVIIGVGILEKWSKEKWLVLLAVVTGYISLFLLLHLLLVGNPFVYFT